MCDANVVATAIRSAPRAHAVAIPMAMLVAPTRVGPRASIIGEVSCFPATKKNGSGRDALSRARRYQFQVRTMFFQVGRKTVRKLIHQVAAIRIPTIILARKRDNPVRVGTSGAQISQCLEPLELLSDVLSSLR